MNAPCQYYRSRINTYEPPHPPEDPSSSPTTTLIEWCEHPKSVYPIKQTPDRLPCGGDLEKCILLPKGDRRKHLRFSNALPLEYRQIDNPKINFSKTTNICEMGLMASLSEQIGVGEKLWLKIYFLSGRDLKALHAIDVTAKVIWAKPDAEKIGHYRTGMEFEDISPKDLEELRAFLNHFGDLGG